MRRPWNGIGLVLMELQRYADAKNAFARAVDAAPEYASAHYNLSFTLSQLGDFDGALRATKRALELEPYYIQQKFQLSIDLQYEDPLISIVPEISADVTGAELGDSFAFDPTVLEGIFDDLRPGRAGAAGAARRRRGGAGPGGRLHQQGAARPRVGGAHPRGGAGRRPRPGGGAAGRHLFQAGPPRRGPRALSGGPRRRPGGRERTVGGGALAARARIVPPTPRRPPRGWPSWRPTNVEALVACARVRLATGDPVRALDALREAQARAPGRADLLQLQAGVSRRLGEREAALDSYQAALQIDSGLVQVWLELGTLEEERQNWTGARFAYQRALDLLPTYSEAARALARLLRQVDSAAAAMPPLIALLGADPWDLDALTLLGELLLDDGRADKAIEAFERVLRFDPESQPARLAYGAALVRARRYREASEQWESLVRTDPSSPLAAAARTQLRSTRDLVHIFTAKAG